MGAHETWQEEQDDYREHGGSTMAKAINGLRIRLNDFAAEEEKARGKLTTLDVGTLANLAEGFAEEVRDFLDAWDGALG